MWMAVASRGALTVGWVSYRRGRMIRSVRIMCSRFSPRRCITCWATVHWPTIAYNNCGTKRPIVALPRSRITRRLSISANLSRHPVSSTWPKIRVRDTIWPSCIHCNCSCSNRRCISSVWMPSRVLGYPLPIHDAIPRSMVAIGNGGMQRPSSLAQVDPVPPSGMYSTGYGSMVDPAYVSRINFLNTLLYHRLKTKLKKYFYILEHVEYFLALV